ncbi:MAG: hypothetical protein WC465_01960 [Patescibacteria group bacterium]
MHRKLDKIFCLPTSGRHKVYRSRGKKRNKKTWWQQIYSLFF